VTPIASQNIAQNGEKAVFELAVSPVYVAVFHDRKGVCPDDCKEPPSGSPAALYGAQPGQADAIEIQEGEKKEIELRFDDSMIIS
jgi:hypothetical protein